jgi:hypothetical protein
MAKIKISDSTVYISKADAKAAQSRYKIMFNYFDGWVVIKTRYKESEQSNLTFMILLLRPKKRKPDIAPPC